MNLLEATVTEIVKIYQNGNYWYVDYKYNVWGAVKDDQRRFAYREDAEKFKVGTKIIV